MLWQKESSDANASYINPFNEKPSADFRDSYNQVISHLKSSIELSVQPGVPIHRKHDGSALKYRQQGNIHFSKKQWPEAMNFYNKSLCFAESNTELSENMSLAYGNRSACFFEMKKFEKCLIDIELAIKANFPPRIMAKLERRRAECLVKIETNKSAEEFKAKLSYTESKKYRGMANVIQIQTNEKFGRHIIANCDIPAGKTVLIEQAFLSRSVEKQYNSCTACLKTSMNFIACRACTNSLFCYDTCAENVQKVHEMECDYSYLDTKSNKEFIIHSIVVAINIFPNVDAMIQFVRQSVEQNTKCVPDSLHDLESKYRAFLRLNVYTGTTKSNENYEGAYKVYQDLMLRKKIVNQFITNAQKHFLMHLILHHIFILNNSYQCNVNNHCAFILPSYVNHSCAPNLLFANNANQIIFVTMRPIKAKEQLFQTYLGDILSEVPYDSVEYRRQYLYDLFGFLCECERCTPTGKKMDWQDFTKTTEHVSVVLQSKALMEKPKFDKINLLILQKRCIDFLNRFGRMQWCDDLGMMMNCYGRLYSKLFED